MIYHVYVKPDSKKESIEPQPDGSLAIRTHKPAHDGEANADVIKILSKYFHTGKTNIKILKGNSSKHKVIEIL